jgi:hypothetical protein
MYYVIALFAGFCLFMWVARRIERDRWAIGLQAIGLVVFLNALNCHYPTDRERFGYGFPWKWQYDPEFRYTGKRGDKHEVTPQSEWIFDRQALVWDMVVAAGVLGLALVGNELWQISQGNRQKRTQPGATSNELRPVFAHFTCHSNTPPE